jgi:predicted  nucleic acid-binding Zn-ribbon protein
MSPFLFLKKERRAMKETTARLIRMQEIYTARAETDEQLAVFPAKRAALQKECEAFEAELKAFSEGVASVRKTIHSLEIDVEALTEQKAKYESQLLEVKTNEAYKTLLGEIKTVREKIHGLEEQILECMTEEEETRKNAEARKREEPSFKQRVESELRAFDEEEKTLRTRREGFEARWSEESGALDAEPLDIFMRLVESRHGIAISRIVGEVCEACAMLVRPQHIQEVRQGEKILLCEHCSRILTWREDEEAASA